MSSPMSRRHSAVVAALALALLMALPGLASAASGPKLLAPKKGAVIAVNTQPTFRVSDKSRNARKYKVWVIVASVKKVKRGELQQDEHGTFSSMRNKGKGRFAWTPVLHTFPDYFLQRPGKYFWQSYHIDCRYKGCHVRSPIRSFTVQ